MAGIGIFSLSDGRPFVHWGTVGFVAETEDRIVAAFQAVGDWVVHAFARPRVPTETFVSRFGADHIHAVRGITSELGTACPFLGIDVERIHESTDRWFGCA